MRRLFLVLALFATHAIAEPIKLKGLGVGMTKAELEGAHPGMAAGCISPRNREICGYVPELARVRIDALETFAGVKVKGWTIPMLDGKSTSVAVILLSTSFDDVVGSLTERFGPPSKRESSVVTNRMGATFDQTEVEWRVDGTRLHVKRRSANVDQMGVYLSSDAAIAEEGKARKERRKAGAGDL